MDGGERQSMCVWCPNERPGARWQGMGRQLGPWAAPHDPPRTRAGRLVLLAQPRGQGRRRSLGGCRLRVKAQNFVSTSF